MRHQECLRKPVRTDTEWDTQLLVYVGVNLLDVNVSTIKKNRIVIMEAIKQAGLGSKRRENYTYVECKEKSKN
jgi:hypothetical protein